MHKVTFWLQFGHALIFLSQLFKITDATCDSLSLLGWCSRGFLQETSYARDRLHPFSSKLSVFLFHFTDKHQRTIVSSCLSWSITHQILSLTSLWPPSTRKASLCCMSPRTIFPSHRSMDIPKHLIPLSYPSLLSLQLVSSSSILSLWWCQPSSSSPDRQTWKLCLEVARLTSLVSVSLISMRGWSETLMEYVSCSSIPIDI